MLQFQAPAGFLQSIANYMQARLSVAMVQSLPLLCCSAAYIATSSALVMVFVAETAHGFTARRRLSSWH